MLDWSDDLQFGLSEPQASHCDGLYIPEAIDCMRCGQCLEHCPTYQLFATEAETPRQRVRSISKLLVDQQGLSSEQLLHLNNCLQCRACESVCPSKMAYAQLLDQAQAKLQQQRKQRWQVQLALKLLQHKRCRKLLLPWLTLYLRSGLQQPLRNSGLLNKLQLAEADALLTPPTLQSLAHSYPVKSAKLRGRVALFSGCLTEHFDRASHKAAIKLLNAIGYEVVVPEQQNCCGAIHQHHGFDAAELITNNLQVFYALEVEAIIYTASGCGAMLSEYQHADSERCGWFVRHLYDINSFLLQHWPASLQLAASRITVAVHEPCTQRNVVKNQAHVYALLAKIPSIQVKPLANNNRCCGAGGSYMLTHPVNAQQFGQLKQQAIVESDADFVVSSNFACSLFLNRQIGQNQPAVLHPVQVLADRL